MSNFNADDLLRITRALNSHEQRCREIASSAQEIGPNTVFSSMCREAAKAKQLSSKVMEALGSTEAALKAAETASHAAQRAEAHAASPCTRCGAPWHPGQDECQTCYYPEEAQLASNMRNN